MTTKRPFTLAGIVASLIAITFVVSALQSFGADWRNLNNGLLIPSESGYADQPYIVVTRDGNWLCVLTTGKGREGQKGQHVVATLSTDKGHTWSPLVDIEPADGPEASWVTPLVVPSGRVYAFYDYNGDNVSTLGSKKNIRADMLGWYVFKYSDDNGRTWSKERYRLPVRVTACDRANDWQGAVQIFWGIDKPKIVGDSVYFAFTKLGKYILDNGEGWLFRSDNILTERDPAKIRWEMLPEGDHGIRAPDFGSVQEEHNLVPLSGGSLYCVYRTTTGRPCHSYSRDGGRTWSVPEHMTYTPGGKKIKNPRACPKLWRTSNGKYLFWFHNNGSEGYNQGDSAGSRNVAWLAGGVEKDGFMHWSQPEIVLYAPNYLQGPSYPDLIEQDGRFWISETQKTAARVHEIDRTLIEGLWNQSENRAVAKEGLVFEANAQGLKSGKFNVPALPDLAAGGGFTVELRAVFRDLSPGQVILESRGKDGRGFSLVTDTTGTVRFEFSDGKTRAAWNSDPGLLAPRLRWQGDPPAHHIVVIVDGGPKVILFVVDGILCDGGDDPNRKYGWGRFHQTFYKNAHSDEIVKRGEEIGSVSDGTAAGTTNPQAADLQLLCIYARALRVSEAVGNSRTGR
ncbi:MAG: exo-alpha-sialidase [Candidatus Sumerlaeia bacterium]|nr:exo-alpha-sialidase [Candidatus Sumerlaeia bacterium]